MSGLKKKNKVVFLVLIVLGVIGLAAWYLSRANIPVLEPAGVIADQQRDLILFALGLSLVVVIPVYILLFSFAWRYRESNHKHRHKYSPELAGNRFAEAVWWLIPTVLISILSVVAWNSSHTLDPYRPIASDAKPLQIQVVAMDWKWLFIYPAQHVASVNFFQFPKDTPLDFEITSDAPMNSFWIPQLGGQIYAMPGMTTQLHLMADRTGSFNGSSANISGQGFASMNFVARSSSRTDYEAWLKQVRRSPVRMDVPSYQQLGNPGTSPVKYYSSVQNGLFEAQVMKYLVPTTTNGRTYHFMPSVSMDMEGM